MREMGEKKNANEANSENSNFKKENDDTNKSNNDKKPKTQSKKEQSSQYPQKSHRGSQQKEAKVEKHVGVRIFVSIITIIIIAVIGIYFYERNELTKIKDLLASDVGIQQKAKFYQDYESKKFILPFLSQKYELQKTYKNVILDDIKGIIEEDFNQVKQLSTKTPDSQRKKIELEKALNAKVNTYYQYTDNHQELYSYLKNTENNLKEMKKEMISSNEKELSSSNDLVSLEKSINFYNLLISEYKHEYVFNDDIYKKAVERMNDMKLVKQYEKEINEKKANIADIKDGLVIYDQINTELYKEIHLNLLLKFYEKILIEAINSLDFNLYKAFKKKYYEDFRDSVLFEDIKRIWIVQNIDNRIKNKTQPAIKEKIIGDIAEYNNTLNYSILQDVYASLLEYKKEFSNSIDFRLEFLKVEELINANKPLYLEAEVSYQDRIEDIMVKCDVDNSNVERQINGNSAFFLIECNSMKIFGDIELQFDEKGKSIFKTHIRPPFIRELEVELNGKKLVVKIEPKNYSEFLIN